MPLYTWRCQHCQAESGVVRTFAEFEIPPGGKEDDGKPSHECPRPEGHKWERTIGGGQTVMATRNWSRHGTKGHW